MLGSWAAAGAFTLLALIVGVVADLESRGWMILAAIIAAVWVGLVIRLFYLQYTVHYSLTSQRFIHERGLLWRQTDRIETIDIDDVTVRQGPIERMFGVGTVRVVSSDRTTPQFAVVGIEDVRRVATLIDNARRDERRKRGLHIETV